MFALKLQEVSDFLIGSMQVKSSIFLIFQQKCIKVLKMMTRDKVIAVQKEARQTLREWEKLAAIQEEQDL